MPVVKAYKVELIASSFISGGRSYAKGFKTLVPETNPEVAFYKQHPRVFKMKETSMTFPDTVPEKPTAKVAVKTDDLEQLGLSKQILAALAKNGVDKISDLKDVTVEALTEFEGIAEASATKIVDAVNEFEKGKGE